MAVISSIMEEFSAAYSNLLMYKMAYARFGLEITKILLVTLKMVLYSAVRKRRHVLLRKCDKLRTWGRVVKKCL